MKRITMVFLALSALTCATPALADGWYLMAPPTTYGWRCDFWLNAEKSGWYAFSTPEGKQNCLNQDHINLTAPLRQWKQQGEYEAVQDCHDELINDIEFERHRLSIPNQPAGIVKAEHVDLEFYENALCVASDDPSLAR
jgi:hypothetical protein